MSLKIFYFCIIVFLHTAIPFFAAGDDIDLEIDRLKKELSRVREQRKHELVQAKKEKDDFAAYQKRTTDRVNAQKRQIDSIQAETKPVNAQNDSITIEITATKDRAHEYELIRVKNRDAILIIVESVSKELQVMPPLIREQYLPPIHYLSGEIKAGNVENTEALFRLQRIVEDARVSCREIQVVEGASPVPELRGTVYRLRIGAIFEAVIHPEGKKAFLWTRSSECQNGDPWKSVEEPETIGFLYKSVLMREGKLVPELVKLPFSTTSGNCDGE